MSALGLVSANFVSACILSTRACLCVARLTLFILANSQTDVDVQSLSFFLDADRSCPRKPCTRTRPRPARRARTKLALRRQPSRPDYRRAHQMSSALFFLLFGLLSGLPGGQNRNTIEAGQGRGAGLASEADYLPGTLCLVLKFRRAASASAHLQPHSSSHGPLHVLTVRALFNSTGCRPRFPVAFVFFPSNMSRSLVAGVDAVAENAAREWARWVVKAKIDPMPQLAEGDLETIRKLVLFLWSLAPMYMDERVLTVTGHFVMTLQSHWLQNRGDEDPVHLRTMEFPHAFLDATCLDSTLTARVKRVDSSRIAARVRSGLKAVKRMEHVVDPSNAGYTMHAQYLAGFIAFAKDVLSMARAHEGDGAAAQAAAQVVPDPLVPEKRSLSSMD